MGAAIATQKLRTWRAVETDEARDPGSAPGPEEVVRVAGTAGPAGGAQARPALTTAPSDLEPPGRAPPTLPFHPLRPPPSPALARTVVLGDALPSGAYAPTLALAARRHPPISRLTMEQFASAMAELGGCRSPAEAVRLRYGLDEATAGTEAEAWAARFFEDPGLFARYGALLGVYAEYVARRAERR